MGIQLSTEIIEVWVVRGQEKLSQVAPPSGPLGFPLMSKTQMYRKEIELRRYHSKQIKQLSLKNSQVYVRKRSFYRNRNVKLTKLQVKYHTPRHCVNCVPKLLYTIYDCTMPYVYCNIMQTSAYQTLKLRWLDTIILQRHLPSLSLSYLHKLNFMVKPF